MVLDTVAAARTAVATIEQVHADLVTLPGAPPMDGFFTANVVSPGLAFRALRPSLHRTWQNPRRDAATQQIPVPTCARRKA